MRHRSRATLGPIVQGLLAAGLCTLAAAAQQAATPPSAGTNAAAHAPNSVAKDVMAPAGDPNGDQTLPASSGANETGVANPDAVTPDASSTSNDQTPASPAAETKPTQAETQSSGTKTAQQPGYVISTPAAVPTVPGQVVKSNDFPAPVVADPDTSPEAGQERFYPDQPPAPLTADHDSDKPAQPDPPATHSAAAAGESDAVSSSPVPATTSTSSDTNAPAPQTPVPAQTAPAADTNSPQPTAPSSTPAAAETSGSQQTAAIYSACIGRGPGTIAECARNARRAGLIVAADNNALCGCKCAGNGAKRTYDLAGHSSAAGDCAIYSARIR